MAWHKKMAFSEDSRVRRQVRSVNAMAYELFPYLYYSMYRAVTRYLCGAHTLVHRYSLSMRQVLNILCVHGCNNVTWKTNFSMRFIFLGGHCCLKSVETLLVCINISPSLLKEPPDCNELACIKALWDEDFCGHKSSIALIAIT